MTDDQPHPDSIGHFLTAMFGGPTVSDGSPYTHTHTHAPEYEEMCPCHACGTAWDDCDASQAYDDEPCCDQCEHEWVPPPPAYTIGPIETEYERYMREIGLGRPTGQ